LGPWTGEAPVLQRLCGKKATVRAPTLVLFLLLALPASAADPQIRNLSALANGNSVNVRFQLSNGFGDADFVRELESGLATGFEYVVEIYRDRPNWFDQGISRTHVEVIATFNSITREYLLNTRRDRKLVRSETFTDLESLERRMSTFDEPALFDISGRRAYKLRVRARADFGRTFLFYVIPSSNTTKWRDVRVTVPEGKP
jgi:hypothetical protein